MFHLRVGVEVEKHFAAFFNRTPFIARASSLDKVGPHSRNVSRGRHIIGAKLKVSEEEGRPLEEEFIGMRHSRKVGRQRRQDKHIELVPLIVM